MYLKTLEAIMDNSEYFKQGYTDAYYGKDNSHLYTNFALEQYKKGQEKFITEYLFNED